MAVLTLSKDQVVALVKQLSPEDQSDVFRFLLHQQWQGWESIMSYGQNQIRQVAQERGVDWDAMTLEEQEALIEQIVQEP